MKKNSWLQFLPVLFLFFFCSTQKTETGGVNFLTTNLEETLAQASQANKIVLVDVFSEG